MGPPLHGYHSHWVCGLLRGQWQLEQCDHQQWQCLTANIHYLSRGVPHSVTVVALSSQLPSAAATNTSTVLTAEPPTSLSAVHETPTSIHVYWTTPTGSITGYEITLQSGGNSSSVLVSGGVSDHMIDSGVSSDADYSVSMVSLNSFARSRYTGPVLAARGESLWYNSTYMF